jgi:hypothetical protein
LRSPPGVRLSIGTYEEPIAPKLADLGVAKKQSMQWQAAARLESKHDDCAVCGHPRGAHGPDGHCIGPTRTSGQIDPANPPMGCSQRCEGFVDRIS